MPMITADPALVASLREEATTLLQGLLRLDTQTPPGNERLAADWICRRPRPLRISRTTSSSPPQPGPRSSAA